LKGELLKEYRVEKCSFSYKNEPFTLSFGIEVDYDNPVWPTIFCLFMCLFGPFLRVQRNGGRAPTWPIFKTSKNSNLNFEK
jgi:hypothetical protein